MQTCGGLYCRLQKRGASRRAACHAIGDDYNPLVLRENPSRERGTWQVESAAGSTAQALLHTLEVYCRPVAATTRAVRCILPLRQAWDGSGRRAHPGVWKLCCIGYHNRGTSCLIRACHPNNMCACVVSCTYVHTHICMYVQGQWAPAGAIKVAKTASPMPLDSRARECRTREAKHRPRVPRAKSSSRGCTPHTAGHLL